MDKLLVVGGAGAVAGAAAAVQVITLVPLTFWVSSSTNYPGNYCPVPWRMEDDVSKVNVLWVLVGCVKAVWFGNM